MKIAVFLVAIMQALTGCSGQPKKEKQQTETKRPAAEAGSSAVEPTDATAPHPVNLPECRDGLLAASINGTPYKCDKGKLVVDADALNKMSRENAHRKKLYWDLRSRVLTDTEMAEVEQYGIRLVAEDGKPYYEEEERRELNDALLQQFRIRIAAGRLKQHN